MNKQEYQYAGFWIRTGAAIIDSVLILIIVGPLLTYIYGVNYWLGSSLLSNTVNVWSILLNYILPVIAVIIFWIYKSATPGKMLAHLRIVDAKTGGNPSARQCIVRYLGYYVSMFPLFLGIIWVAIDRRKQGWHDKLAGTLVIRNEPSGSN